MAIRNTTHVLKNSDIVNRPLPSSLLKGEPIVNTADGIMYFSGFTTSTNEWTPAGTGTTANFFEVGSNLYDLRLRNQITKYQGQTGSGLVGKFLSGTTSGFVLADISDIAASVDSYTTGATWSPNVLTIGLNNGKPSVPVTIDSFTALTINGNLNVTGTEIVNNLTITGTGLYNTTATGTNSLEIVNYGSLTAFSQTNDVYVTGSTLTQATDNTDSQSSLLLYHGTPIGGGYTIDTENTFTTGGTWNSGTTAIDFTRNDGVVYSVSLSNIDVNDTYVTGGTVTSGGTLNLFRNDGVTVSVPGVTYWTSGSSGSESIKAINSTGLESTGDRAVAWGNQTLALGNDSTAWGYQTSATTVGSTASGYQTLASGQYSHSQGGDTIASGDYSTASGYYSVASGKGSTASGAYTTASGTYSHAEGDRTIASGSYSHAEGYLTTALGNGSHAEGASTSATTSGAHAEGYQTIASSAYAHAEGGNTSAINQFAHAEGYVTLASGLSSHAEGSSTSATTTNAHSEGNTTLASGTDSHAEGQNTIASGGGSHAEGGFTTASGTYSHAEGYNTSATGINSHAEGQGTTASGNYSHAQGSGTYAQGQYSFASGINTFAVSQGSFIHSENSLVNGTRSVVLGGQNITGSTADTVYVPYLNLNYVPTLNNSNTQILSRNTGTGQVEYTPLSAISSFDTYVTGFTYNPSTNTFTVSQNQGQPDLTASINSVSGLSFSNLTQGRVVYVGPGGLLTDESTFTYNDGTNTLSVDNIEAAGSVVIQGDLTVLGAAISAFTSNLYVEDPNITLNYNPTGSTIATSVNAGFTIQDGNGVSGGSVNFDIVRMQNLTGLTGTEIPSVTEYTALTGYPNRGWVTQLNDIVIRSTDPTDDGSFNGVRVLAEFDILDAGSY